MKYTVSILTMREIIRSLIPRSSDYAVENLEHVPEGMRGLAIEGGAYEKHPLKGNLLQGLVYNAWVDIWSSGISRAYTADFEVYGAAAQNPEDAAVDIFIATR